MDRKNNCPLRNTEKCKEFLKNLNARCDGNYFYDGEGHSLPVTECDILKETYGVRKVK